MAGIAHYVLSINLPSLISLNDGRERERERERERDDDDDDDDDDDIKKKEDHLINLLLL